MTLLVKNVYLLGVRAKEPLRADVFVQNDVISAIGSFPNKKADEVIDGQGAFLAPGFIDVHSFADRSFDIVRPERAAVYLAQGITTVICGQGGISLAPFLPGDEDFFRGMNVPRGANIDWRTAAEFFSSLEKRPWGVNVATLAGYETIRATIIGDALRVPTKNERDVIRGLLARTLGDGALGVSLALGNPYAHAMPPAEWNMVLGAVSKCGGVCSVEPALGERNHAELLSELLPRFKLSRAAAFIPHLFSPYDRAAAYRTGLNALDALPKESRFYFGISPFSAMVISFEDLLPAWAKKGSRRETAKAFADPWLRSKILKELPALKSKSCVIVDAAEHRSLLGTSLWEVMAQFGRVDERHALIRLMEVTRLRGALLCGGVERTFLNKALAHPRAFILSHAGMIENASAEHPLLREHAAGAFPAYLKMAEEGNVLPLEEAVRKITALPARLFRIPRRGAIREGYHADLVGFKNGKVAFVVVNGAPAFGGGGIRNVAAGRVVLRGHTGT